MRISLIAKRFLDFIIIGCVVFFMGWGLYWLSGFFERRIRDSIYEKGYYIHDKGYYGKVSSPTGPPLTFPPYWASRYSAKERYKWERNNEWLKEQWKKEHPEDPRYQDKLPTFKLPTSDWLEKYADFKAKMRDKLQSKLNAVVRARIITVIFLAVTGTISMFSIVFRGKGLSQRDGFIRGWKSLPRYLYRYFRGYFKTQTRE